MPAGGETRARRLRQRDEPWLQLLPRDLENDQRSRRSPPPLGRAPRVEDPDAAEALDLRQVRMAVHDRVAAGEPSDEASLPPPAAARLMHEADPGLRDYDHGLLRQQLNQRRLVVVATHRFDGAVRPQLLEHGDG